MQWSFVFVCQAGELEIKSMLLAASLRQFLRCDYELVAAIPQPINQWGQIAASTQALMQTLGVRSVPITNSIDLNYPIGNKVACLGIESIADKIVFLDSDILCLREFSLNNQELAKIFQVPFAAKPADLATFTRDSQLWQQIYDLFQLPLPQWRVIATVSGELMWPYFNAGVIAIANGMDFAQVWQQCCQQIDAHPTIPNKRPWLDQIALPIAVNKLNLKHNCLDERFNYPAHLKPLPTHLPIWCHYHWPTVIRREPQLNQLVVKLAKTYPELQALLLSSPSWAQLLKSYTLAQPVRRLWPLPCLTKRLNPLNSSPQVIITGIPRSGTSYLCRLLHTLPDCVVINEPIPIFKPLINELWPWSLATFYQELRRDILDGQPVVNKVDNGQLIEDTAINDNRTLYQPQVSRPDFLLGTKNTLAYLARIPQLKQVLPQVPIVACVRHPLDTIASWKTSFPHLHNAAVTEFPIGHVNDPVLLPWQRQRLAEIVATTHLAWKRALLWRYLAEVILTYAQQLLIIRYEDLVTQPRPLLKKLLRQIPQAPALYLPPITPSTIRQQREILDDDDRQAIADIGSPYAIELGYTID